MLKLTAELPRGRYCRRTLESLAMYDESEVPLDVIIDLVQHIHAMEGEGAILIFLSGWEEISAVRETPGDAHVSKHHLVEISPLTCVIFRHFSQFWNQTTNAQCSCRSTSNATFFVTIHIAARSTSGRVVVAIFNSARYRWVFNTSQHSLGRPPLRHAWPSDVANSIHVCDTRLPQGSLW